MLRCLAWVFGWPVRRPGVVLIVVGVALAMAYPNLPALDDLTDYRPKMPLRVSSRRRRADRRIRRGAAQPRRRIKRHPGGDEERRAGDRGRALLRARRRRLHRHAARRRCATSAAAQQPGRLDHHDAGGAQLLPVDARRPSRARSTRCCSPSRSSSSSRKDQILEVYMNQIYLGQRAYGFAAAARDLLRQAAEGHHDRRGGDAGRPAEGAVGLQPGRQPEARARAPAVHPASACRSYGFITDEQYDAGAASEELHDHAPAAGHRRVHAEYVAEMARQLVYAQYGDETYTRGLNVFTTIDCGRPGRRLPGAAQGHHGLRAAPGLPRPGRLRRPARPTRSEPTTRSTTRWPSTPTTTTSIAAVVLEASPKQVRAVLRRRRDGRRSPATACVRAQSGLSDKAPPKTHDPPRRDHPRRRRTPRATGRSRSCRKSKAPSSRSTRTTARSARWSAASTSTRTSSTT